MAAVWKRGAGLGDVRLDERAAVVLEQIVETHSLVMTKLGKGRAGEVAAGRLLKSEKVDVDGLMAPHVARTADAVRGRRIIAAQDTTEACPREGGDQLRWPRQTARRPRAGW